MNETLTLQPDGARLYVVGPSYPLRDALKRAGCH